MSTHPFLKHTGHGARGGRLLAAGSLLGLLGALASCHWGAHYTVGTIFVPNSIAVADVNADGAPDLLVATTADEGSGNNPGFANVILNSAGSRGTFHTGVQYPTTGDNPSSIAVADLTHSGSLDLVVANSASGSVSVYMHGASPGTFKSAVNVITGGVPNQVVIGDLNGDGRPDLVVADMSASGNAIVLLADPASPGQFLAPVSLATGAVTTSAAIGDLNGDGLPDIVAATSDSNGNNGAVYVFYQDPASRGSFLPAVKFPAGAQPQSVKIADVNGDGLPDIIVANVGPGSDGTGAAGVSVLLQDAAHPGQFLAAVTYATAGSSVDVAVGDLNGDGKPDLVVANLDPAPTGSVSVLLQDPSHAGVFLAASDYSGFGQPLGVAIADLNGDGHPDVAVADSTTATVMLQDPSAPGTFSPPVQVGN